MSLILFTGYFGRIKETVKAFFPKDHTHTGYEGANLNALTVAESLKKIKECGLKEYIEIPEKK